MPTFSNTPYDADQLNNLYDILQKYPNNTANLIKPKDLRDGVYTIWENILFKITSVSGSTYSYFGIDDNDSRNKLYLGKKTISGTPIMSNILLSSDSDYYIYNNKSDSNPSQQNTKISFLAGASSSDYTTAPYILAKKITSPSRIDLDIINPATGGSIAIGSTVNSISIGGIIFPLGASASVGNALVYIGSNQLSWAATPVLLANSPFIPMIGTGGALYDSHLKQNGNSVQLINGRYLSDTSGLIRLNFMTGSGIELSTDGGALSTPNVIIDSNKIRLSNPFGSATIDNFGITLTHSYLAISSTLIGNNYQNMYLTSSGGRTVITGSSTFDISTTDLSIYSGLNKITITNSITTITGSNIFNISSGTISTNAINQYQYNSKYSQIGTSASFTNAYLTMTNSQVAMFSSMTHSIATNAFILNPLTQSYSPAINSGWISKIIDFKSIGDGVDKVIYNIRPLVKDSVIMVKCYVTAMTDADRGYVAELFGGFTYVGSAILLPDPVMPPNVSIDFKKDTPAAIYANIIVNTTSPANGIDIIINDGLEPSYFVVKVEYMINSPRPI